MRSVVALVVIVALASSVDAQENAPPSRVCRAELFLESFGPSPDDPSLRTTQLEMAEQVRLAFYGIDATRVEVERGRLSPTEGEEIIETYRDTLRNYVHDQFNEAMITASSGQASDIPNIYKSLGTLLSISRQDGLMGRESSAQEAQQKMIQVLRIFSQRFLETCEQQTFRAEVAVGLERQNELLGTGIDVTKCASRRLTATIQRKKTRYQWESCSIDGGGVWNLTLTGDYIGQGPAEMVSVKWPADTGEGLWHGKLKAPPLAWNCPEDEWCISFQVKIDKQGETPSSHPAPPDDAGPNARPNNCLQETVPALPSLKPFKIGTLRMESQEYFPTESIETPILLEQKPCAPAKSPDG